MNSIVAALDRARPVVLGLFRIVVALLFTCHGAATLFDVFGGAANGGPGPAAFTWPGWYASVIQLVGGILVFLGLGTRLAALACSGSMAYAYFDIHQKVALLPIENHGEPAAMFCWAFLLIAVLGAGAFSLEALLKPSAPRDAAHGPRSRVREATAVSATAEH
jgi:putative oxidoreductase